MIALSSSNRAALARLPIAALAIYLLGTIGAAAQTVSDSVPILQKVNVVEHLGETIPLGVAVTNDAGEKVMMGRYFTPGRPVVLVLAYYECPMLCNLVMNSLTQTAKQLSWLPGQEYQIVTVSINPAESFSLARGKKDNYIRDFGQPEAAAGWDFCIAAEDQSRKLADAVGFKYYYDELQKQYAHPAVITILTGSGVISRYLYGVEFKERDLRLALLEASEGKIGTTVDRILLYCYHYDPNAGGYVLMAGTIMRTGGLFTIVLLALFLGLLWRREGGRRRRSRSEPPSNGTTAR